MGEERRYKEETMEVEYMGCHTCLYIVSHLSKRKRFLPKERRLANTRFLDNPLHQGMTIRPPRHCRQAVSDEPEDNEARRMDVKDDTIFML